MTIIHAIEGAVFQQHKDRAWLFHSQEDGKFQPLCGGRRVWEVAIQCQQCWRFSASPQHSPQHTGQTQHLSSSKILQQTADSRS